MPKKKARPGKSQAKKPASKPRKPRAAAKSEADRYAAHREAMSVRSRQASEKSRDIGPVPNIKDVKRRDRCRNDLRLFGETYFPEALATRGMHWPLCRDQLEAIERIEDATLHGALYALGMSRGFSKTTWIRIGALWAWANGHKRYPFVIGATDPKAVKNLEAIKSFVRFGMFGEDFTEVSFPVRCLGGTTQRSGGQLSQGEPTLIRWHEDELILPAVLPPKNWPKDWLLRADGKVPTSGSCMSVSGLTGEGIRGSLMTTDTGEQLRPDLILIDDPQTRESAKSPSQNQTRIELVSGDVLGMAGPGENISAVMLCTPIYPGDMADVMLERKKHPLWRGDRRPMMRSLPKDMGAWDDYFQIYAASAQLIPPDYSKSNAHYVANRAKLDEGAEPAWEECYNRKTELSAIQSAMHLYFRDPRAFASERQLTPLAIFSQADDLPKLTVEMVHERSNSHERGLVPAWATTLTASMDVHDNLIYYCVTAWADGCAGAVVDYGTWPRQNRSYFTKRDAAPTLTGATGIGTIEGAIYAGLKACCSQLLGQQWKHAAGMPMRISQALIDCGYKEDVVYRFCRESEHAAILLASRGYGIGSGKAPMGEWRPVPGERKQKGPAPTWTIRLKTGRGRNVLFDANWWKTFTVERLLVSMGDKSALTVFADDHRLFADHCTAEFRERTSNDRSGRKVDEWQEIPGRDNHFLDVLVGTAVGASLQGISLGGSVAKPIVRPVVNVAKEQAAAKASIGVSATIGASSFEEMQNAAAVAQPKKQDAPQKLSIADEVKRRREEFEARRRTR